MKRKRTIAFAKILQDPGRNDGQSGKAPMSGWIGTSIASAMSAFASAPPKRSPSWKNVYIRAIMIGMKMRYQRFGNPPSRYCMINRMSPNDSHDHPEDVCCPASFYIGIGGIGKQYCSCYQSNDIQNCCINHHRSE